MEDGMKVSLKMPIALFACWLAAAPVAAWADGAPDDGVAATAVNVNGDVKVQTGQSWQAVEEGQIFSAGDRLTTGENSTLQLVLADGSSVALGADSELTLDDAGAGAEGSVTLITLARGLLDAMVQKLKLGSRFEVQTPYAVAAVKGTDFEVSGAYATAAVTVNEGVVQFGDAERRAFEPVRPLQRGQFVDGRLVAALPLSLDEQEAFHHRWAEARILHARRFELLRRFRPMRRRFLRQMRVRRAFRARHRGRGNRGRMVARRGQIRRRRPVRRRPQ
jgi:hypothetical protein